jgi:ATP-dependent 26S proteasome regulatory subunit
MEANQRLLAASLAEIKGMLQGSGSKDDATAKDGEEQVDSDNGSLPLASTLEALSSIFGLSSFERDILLLCAGVELDSSFQRLIATAQGDPARDYPTFSLAMTVLPGAHWSALLPAAPLRRWRLAEVGEGSSLTQSPLRIDERILHYLTGLSCLDERLQSLMEPVPSPGDLPASHSALADRAAGLLSGSSEPPVIQFCGGTDGDREAIAASASAMLGMRLYRMDGQEVPAPPREREALRCLWEREAALSGSALLIGCDDLEPGSRRSVTSFIESIRGMVIVSSHEPIALRRRAAVRLDVKRPCAAESLDLWKRALGDAAQDMNGAVEAVAAQFGLGAQGILSACSEVLAEGVANEDAGRRLWEACRSQARPLIEGLAQRIEPAATWDEIVLPEAQVRTLHEIATHVRQRSRVYDDWGFASKGERGLGISALFSGSSGTGKTIAAEVLASDLNLDLYRIDLSQVVSKYIGETEKNLRRVFDAAEGGGAILLFDEADALFGRRSEVRDSHDRYANIEVSYLLQRMEAYRGLAILTTNMKAAIDQAFMRRIRFSVQFPFPDASQRALIWRRIYPPGVPVDGLNIERLSRLNIAGGSIRNIALYAAFLAADEGRAVSMVHILRAAKVEYSKMEKTMTEQEVKGWI